MPRPIAPPEVPTYAPQPMSIPGYWTDFDGYSVMTDAARPLPITGEIFVHVKLPVDWVELPRYTECEATKIWSCIATSGVTHGKGSLATMPKVPRRAKVLGLPLLVERYTDGVPPDG